MKGSAVAYKLTIFLGAFLLFAVQFLLAKYLLPWFGGAPAVWTTCMLFFQTMLLAGYAYAHGLSNSLRPRAQSTLHFFLLLACLALLVSMAFVWPSPITPDTGWKPQGSEPPIWNLIVLLSVSVGMPYFVLSTTGPLMQSWFARAHPAESPYRLYSLSNLGSFLALLSYPFLVEPWLTLNRQARLWSLGFFGYAIGCIYCAVHAKGEKASSGQFFMGNTCGKPSMDNQFEVNRPGLASYALWLGLAACGSLMLLATTSQICQDIAAVPLLWVLPLCLYLISFVVCFEKSAWYPRVVFHSAFGFALLAACYVLNGGAIRSIIGQIAIYSFILFTCCMLCHGELHRLKPDPQFLTSFYLVVAAGGAIGGVFAALIAPHLFPAFWEYQLGLWVSAFLMFVILMRDQASWLFCSRSGVAILAISILMMPVCVALGAKRKIDLAALALFVMVSIAAILLFRRSKAGFDALRARAAAFLFGIGLLVFAGLLFLTAHGQLQTAIQGTRNFYGLLTIREQGAGQSGSHAFFLIHGRISHGFQFRDEAKRRLPTGYFGPASGVGLALQHIRLQDSTPSAGQDGLRIGVVGLGVGTLSAYAKKGDYIRFYEINPEVVRFAWDTRFFSYLHDCPAQMDIIQGDARLSMEAELDRGEAQQFDLLAIDAFSGDAIPIHLLTQEAFQIYLNEIKGPTGVLAVHISNNYLDLSPVLKAVADHFGIGYLVIHSRGDGMVEGESIWVLLSQNATFLGSLAASTSEGKNTAPPSVMRMWTDDYSNLLQVLRR